MFKNWKTVLLISLLMLYMACEQEDCWFVHNPAGTDPRDPSDPIEYYDYILTYQRTAIFKPENLDPSEVALVVLGKSARSVQLTKLDNYTFSGEIQSLRTHVSTDELSHAIYVVDKKRWEEEWIEGIYLYGRPHSVGDIFILKCKQTNAEKRLMKIVPNTNLYSLPAKCDPKMAQFRIKKGGVIIDE